MSDFGELCPLFHTGVYNELYLGRITTTLYVTSSMNFLNGAADLDTGTMSFNLGRTVVVTNFWARRMTSCLIESCSVFIGRQTDTGSAPATVFGSLIFASAVTAFPDLHAHWRPATTMASFTLNTADYLYLGCNGDGDTRLDLIVQYREK